MKKKLFSLLLALCMVLTLLPVTAMAEQPQVVDEITVSQDAVQLLQARAEGVSVCQQAETANAGEYYTEAEDAAAELRSKLEARTESITVPVQIPVGEMENTEENFNLLALGIFAMAIDHTGVPTQGDYLLWHIKQAVYFVDGTYDSSYYYLDLIYNVTYHSSITEEHSVANKLDKVMTDLHFDSDTSDYTKIWAIYDYVYRNVNYSSGGAFSYQKFSAWGAITRHEAEPQGFASLLYRALLMHGIDTRIISGTENGKAHVWNIVKLGSVYYCLDATLDSLTDTANHFLKAPSSNYSRAEAYDTAQFHAAYPMASADYTLPGTQILTKGMCGDAAFWTLYTDGKLEITGSGPVSSRPWYPYRNAMKTVTVAEGITSLPNANFAECPITSISLPSTLTAMGSKVFSECAALTEITIPDGVKEIKPQSFENCTSLRHVKLPASLTLIEQQAFEACSALERIVIPDGVTDIPHHAFSYCRSLSSVVLPASLKTIGGSAFSMASSLQTITFPDTLTTIGSSAFQGTGLTSLSIPDNVTSIGADAFINCTALRSVSLGSALSGISNRTFSGCTALQTVTIPATVTKVGANAFEDVPLLYARFTGNFPTISDIAFVQKTLLYYPCNNATWKTFHSNFEWQPDHNFVDFRCTHCDAVDPMVDGVIRIAGQSRYDTSFLIADTLKQRLAVDKFDAVIVTSGENFADALAGSYLAYLKSAPILLTDNDNIADVMDYIRENLAESGTVYALGGAAVVTDELQAIASDGFVFKRLAGATRFETNLEILKECGDLSGQEFLICTGYNFADSLSASAARRPIMLVDDALSAQQKDFFSQLGSCEFWIIGGTGAVSETVEQQVKQYNQYGEVQRLRGTNRYETSRRVADRLYDAPLCVVFAYGDNFPDGLCAGPLAATLNVPLLLVDNGDPRWAQLHVSDFDCSGGYVLGGPTLIGDDTIREIFKWSKNSPFNN